MAQIRYIGLVAAAATLVLVAGSNTAQAQSEAPDGIWVAGGINASAAFRHWGPDGAGVRLEAGIPLVEAGPGLLNLALPLSTVHDPYRGGVRARRNSLMLAPEIQWEYPFDINMPHRLSLSPAFGMGIVGGIWDGGRDIDGGGAFMINWKTGVNLRFGFDFGLILQIQPLGFTFNLPFRDGDTFYTAYEWYTSVGYRF
ncbi:MAG: hypothetical protein ACODAG_03670 [Myxococcota bacterium]